MFTHHLSDTTKGKLRAKVQELRTRLLMDIRVEADRRYRLSMADAERTGLRADLLVDRRALDAWLDNRRKAGVPRERALDEAVAEAAHTLLHRLVFIRHMEATGLLPVKLLTGGIHSHVYQEAREWLPELVGRPDDASKGFAPLLDLLYAELADDMPGLFGNVGTIHFFPVPPTTLLAVVETLDDPGLQAAWPDDTTPGWVYQFWNDPEKERIDGKISAGKGKGTSKGKVAPHEIAAKTALYTERYMVEWLLHNSLGPLWLAICRKNEWTADGQRALDGLAAKRAGGRVDIADDDEDRWKYYVDVDLSDAFVERAPSTLRDLRLLDPACGSGHFLVAAFDWLFAAWKEEARHRGAAWTDAEIAEAIVEENLHGIDIDSRSVQIAATAVWLKARLHGGRPRRMHLVASRFELGRVEAGERTSFVRHLAETIGVETQVVDALLRGLGEADTQGSLLHVDQLDEQILPRLRQIPLMAKAEVARSPDLFHAVDARDLVLDQIVRWLRGLTRSDDLGVRLGAEQLAAGLRFVGMLRDGMYDVVVANPPYLTTRKLASEVAKAFSDLDLYACFLRRGLDLVRAHGVVAMVTMHGWMFLGQFEAIRKTLLQGSRLRALAELGVGAFSEIGGHVTSVVMTTYEPMPWKPSKPGDLLKERVEPVGTTRFIRAKDRDQERGLLLQHEVYQRDAMVFRQIESWPVVYWWSPEFLERYVAAPKLKDVAPVRQGMATADNPRFLRKPWEIPRGRIAVVRFDEDIERARAGAWVPYIKGAAGKVWIEPLDEIILWRDRGLTLQNWIETYRLRSPGKYIKNEGWYFRPGVAYVSIGSGFAARAHEYRSIIGHKGPSVFGESRFATVAAMNSLVCREVLQGLNPGLGFEVGDVNRLAVFPVPDAQTIFSTLESAFAIHESHRETSVEFVVPGPSPWQHAQEWAQAAVDRPEGAPLPPYTPTYDPRTPTPSDFVSHALGICLGRFPPREPSDSPLPHGILFLAVHGPDNLAAAKPLLRAWEHHGNGTDLRDHLRLRFIKEHLDRYEARPIHWPLSSEKRSFVAWVCIHTFEPGTLDRIRAEHLVDCVRALEGELAALRTNTADAGPRKGSTRRGSDPIAETQALLDELVAFDRLLEQISLRGPHLSDQEREAPYHMELEDGVRVNSAALFPLLKAQWKEPEKWWREISAGTGRPAADWSTTAARYWPRRVARKCVEEPSHAVAHGCFWQHHPARAYDWELRLQDEIGPNPDGSDFLIDEPGATEARHRFLRDQPEQAERIREKARRRREHRETRQTSLFDDNTQDEDSEA